MSDPERLKVILENNRRAIKSFIDSIVSSGATTEEQMLCLAVAYYELHD